MHLEIQYTKFCSILHPGLGPNARQQMRYQRSKLYDETRQRDVASGRYTLQECWAEPVLEQQQQQ